MIETAILVAALSGAPSSEWTVIERRTTVVRTAWRPLKSRCHRPVWRRLTTHRPSVQVQKTVEKVRSTQRGMMIHNRSVIYPRVFQRGRTVCITGT